MNYLMNRFTTVASMMLFTSATVFAQVKSDSIPSVKSKEEGNRNVMLNAASANGPREISIGLPGGDVNVLENGLPVVYTSNPHNVNSHWRNDGSLNHSGLLKISETAITTGNIGYAVNSFTELGSEEFAGKINYNTNHFGKQQFDLTLTGSLGKNWYFIGSAYQDFDPGTIRLGFAQYQDRTQIYKLGLTKRYDNNHGEFTALYHFSESHNLMNATIMAPFIYVGDGSIKELPGFSLGTSNYLPSDGVMTYRDMRTGELKNINMYDAPTSRGNEFMLMNSYRWDNDMTWNVKAKYDHSLGSLLYQTPMSMTMKDEKAGYSKTDINGNLTPYSGYVQSRMSCFNRGKMDDILFTTELTKVNDKSTWRIGMNEWYYHADYASCTTMYDQSVEANPQRLQRDGYTNGMFYDFNKNASEYYKAHENKLALYATHDWDISDKLNVYYGARLEWLSIGGENASVYGSDGKAIGRFADYYLGAKYDVNGQKGTIAAQKFSYNWLNTVFTAALTYKMTDKFGFTADFTYNTQRPKLENFSPAELPNTARVSIPLGRGGIYYNNNWISLTSLFSYIAKSNNNSTLNLINPQNSNEIKAAPLTYDIQTIGWTTDAVLKPIKNFDMHLRFTYQKPTYKKYETSVTFASGNTEQVNVTGNTVTEIPEVLIEIDPSYMLTKDLKVWTSFRYFSKTQANIENAYYFNGRWETFGGMNWQVNKKFSLGCTIINFLNQTGASGSIAGVELTKKEDARNNYGAWMAGSYIRPFTVEFSASLKF